MRPAPVENARAQDPVIRSESGASSVDGDARSLRRRRTWRSNRLAWFGLWALLALPLVVALAALWHPRWYPLLDYAMTELRVRDVGSSHPPLIGLPGRLGGLQHQGSHPGPLSFYALWPVYRLLGQSSWALQAATTALQVLAMGVSLWIANRRGGMRLVIGVTAVLALLARGYGITILIFPWNPHLPVLLWFVFLLAVWSVFCDDWVMLPVAAVAGSFSAQTHIPYFAPAMALTGAATAWALLAIWRHRIEGDQRRRAVRWLICAAAAFAVVWTPPVIDQFTARAGEGNLTVIWDTLRNPPEVAIGLGAGVRLLLVHLNVWDILKRDTTATSGSLLPGLVLLIGWLLAVAGAVRLRHRSLLALDAVIGLALLLAVASLSRIYGFVWYYLMLWTWGITALMLVVIGWTVASIVAARPEPGPTGDRESLQHERLGRAGLATLVVATIVLAALFTREGLTDDIPQQRLSRTLAAVAPGTVRALRSGSVVGGGRDGRYLITWVDPIGIGSQAFGLLDDLERHGLTVGLSEANRVAAHDHRVIQPDKATAVVHLSVGPADIDRWRAIPGAKEVAYVEPRTPAEQAEYARLRRQVIAGLRAAGRSADVHDVDANLLPMSVQEGIPKALNKPFARMIDLGLPTAVFVGPPGTAS